MIGDYTTYFAALERAHQLLVFAESDVVQTGMADYLATGEHNTISREVQSAKELAALYIDLARVAQPSGDEDS